MKKNPSSGEKFLIAFLANRMKFRKKMLQNRNLCKINQIKLNFPKERKFKLNHLKSFKIKIRKEMNQAKILNRKLKIDQKV